MAVIFWFSGTGNSLCAAKQLAEGLGGADLVRITDEAPSGSYGGEGEKIGFVLPSYYCNMPRAVQAFIEKLDIKAGTYVFGIVTMGGMGQGTVNALEKAVKAKGLRLNYGRGAKMPANYVVMYNPADPAGSGEKLGKASAQMKEFADEIAAGKELVKGFPYNGKILYRNIAELDKGFAAGDGCTDCGLCEKACPVRNIRIESGKPKWLGHCERCVSCISWCPVHAIECGKRTQGRRRYRNPEIKVNELTRE